MMRKRFLIHIFSWARILTYLTRTMAFITKIFHYTLESCLTKFRAHCFASHWNINYFLHPESFPMVVISIIELKLDQQVTLCGVNNSIITYSKRIIEILIVVLTFLSQCSSKLKLFKKWAKKMEKFKNLSVCPANPPTHLWPYSYFNQMPDNFLLD